MIVWVWESGEYSDYTVHGVYDSAETAKLAAEYSLTGPDRLKSIPWERGAADSWVLDCGQNTHTVRSVAVVTAADLAPTCRIPLLARVRTTYSAIKRREQLTFTAASCERPLGHDGPHDWEAREAEILAETGAAWRMVGPAERISA